MQLIGILTLARSDNTPAFQRLRKGLRKYYNEGVDISLHFRFANDETELPSLAMQLLRIPVDVMVTGGMQALNAVTARSHDAKIVHIGDKFPPGAGAGAVPNPITGYYLDGQTVGQRQLDKLVIATNPNATITVLVVDDPTGGGDPMQNPLYAALEAYRAGHYQNIRLNPRLVVTRAELHALNSGQIDNAFMLIPNGMLYDEKDFIASLVSAAGVPAVFPEREYKKAMGPNPPHTWVRGHDIPATFEKAADHIRNFLDGNATVNPSEANSDIDPGA
jgi:hypothetical protein